MGNLLERTEALVVQQRLLRQEQGVDWDHEFEVRAALLLNLATSLDKGAGLAQAAVSKEFRQVVAEIMKEADSDNSDDDWLSGLNTPVSGFGVAGVSPMGHTT
jgi:hypothetical protein